MGNVKQGAKAEKSREKNENTQKKQSPRENDFTALYQGIAVKVGNFAGRLVKNCKRQILDKEAAIPL